MTRSHKANDRDHKALAEGTAVPQEHLPRYFAKHGHVQDPNKTKKNGGGKANWGDDGVEVVDEDDFNFAHPRRRSNSHTNNIRDFRTKFDVNETEPVFEESVHGPQDGEVSADADVDADVDGHELSKTETSDSSSTGTGEA